VNAWRQSTPLYPPLPQPRGTKDNRLALPRIKGKESTGRASIGVTRESSPSSDNREATLQGSPHIIPTLPVKAHRRHGSRDRKKTRYASGGGEGTRGTSCTRRNRHPLSQTKRRNTYNLAGTRPGTQGRRRRPGRGPPLLTGSHACTASKNAQRELQSPLKGSASGCPQPK